MKKMSIKSGSMSLISKMGPLIGLFLVFGLFTIIAPDNFSSLRSIETIARQATIVGIASLGMTMVIILGGIDLSVGSIVALSSVVIATVLSKMTNIDAAQTMFDSTSPFGIALLAAFSGIIINIIRMILIATINPNSSGPCFLIQVLILDSNWRIVGVYHFGLQYFICHQIIKRPQQISTTSCPATHRRTLDINIMAAKYAFQTI